MALTKMHSMRDFFRVWFTWKIQAVIAFVLIVGIVMLFSYVYTPDFTSSAKILILPKTSREVVISAGDSENRILPVSLEDVNTEIELLTSYEVIRDTVKSFKKDDGIGLKIQDSPWYGEIVDFIKKAIGETLIFFGLKERLSPFESNVVLLGNSLEVEPSAKSNIIVVRLKAERPKAASVVLNRLLETYMAKHNDALNKEEGIQFFNKQVADYYNKLEASEKKVKEFQKKWDIVDLKRQKEANINLLTELTQDLKRDDLEYDETKGRIGILKKAMAKNERDIIITKEMRIIPSIVELEKNIVPLLVKRGEMQRGFNLSSREYRDLETQIEVLRGDVRNEITKAVKTDEMELKTLKVKRDSLGGQIEKLREELSLLNQRERTLRSLEREAMLLENNYMLYASKTEDARIYREQKKQNLANVHIADKASIPVKPSFPNRLLMLFVSLVSGFFAALGIPFILEFLDHRLKTPAEVNDLLSLPVTCSFIDERS